MSETASLDGIEMHAISSSGLPRAEPQNDDPGTEGEISGSVKSDKLSQQDPDTHDINGCSGSHDQHEGTNAPIQADSLKSPRTNDKPTSVNEKNCEHSQAQAAGTAPMNGGRTDENMERLVCLFREFLEAASDSGPETSNNNSNPPYIQRKPGRKRLFGLAKGLPPEPSSNNRFNYEQKYPRDRFGEETAENARIWLTYLDEAEAFDRDRLEGWKETVDVLLVFAGLFSGVITTFISQASQSLQQDNTQVTASLLFETVQILRTQFSGLSISNVPNSTLTPTSPFTPSTDASLVNGLWFTSLAITLSTALFAVLAKQWLHYYMASFSGTANAKVRARQLRFNGFEQWKVAAIVDLLPILLHLAVGLFLTGIMILLFPLDAHIAWTIVVITGITFTLYFISVILPIRYPECPYTTSLTIYAGILFFALREIPRWVSAIWQFVWLTMKLEARHMIQRLVDYIPGFFQVHFRFTSKLGGDGVHRGVGRHQPRNSPAEFPKFAKWREENITRAVSNATFLDSQAIEWLYTTSADISVHRIIARSVAVHPTIAGQFQSKMHTLFPTLEVSRTNIQDLRYGLCLDLLGSIPRRPHWFLLKSISDHVAESELEEAEYNTYLRLPSLEFGVSIFQSSGELSLDCLIASSDSVELPLALWCHLLKRMSRNDTMATHVLKPRDSRSNLFHCKFDPTRELVKSAGLVSFGSYKLGWWKLEYLFDYFNLGKPDLSSETKSYATRYLLLITVYRKLTSNNPLITNKEERQKSLEHLFDNFWWYYHTAPQSPEHCFTFFKDIFCTDSFWSEFVTDHARDAAARCLSLISAQEASLFPRMDYHELSLIYQWCSRDLNKDLSLHTSLIFTALLLSRNRHHLSTILLNDLEAASNLSTCLRNLGNCYYPSEQGKVIYSLLMDLLKSVKMPLFIFYSSSALVQVWQLISRFEQDPEQFFLLVKSEHDRERLDELFTAMKDRERLNLTHPTFHFKYDHDRADFDHRLQASLHVFRQMIGPSQQPPPGAMSDNDHDNEERAQVPGPSERLSVANWTKKAFGYLWSKLLAK